MSYEQNSKIDTIDSIIQLNLLLTEKWLYDSHLLPYSHSYSKSRDALASKNLNNYVSLILIWDLTESLSNIEAIILFNPTHSAIILLGLIARLEK